MITAGIDMGAKTIKVVIVKDNKALGQSIIPTGFEPLESAQKALEEAIQKAEISRNDIKKIYATGAGRKTIPYADHNVTEVTADAKGAVHLIPSARTVIDIGAEEARGISVDASGRVVDFAKNDKCAAGAGAFVESMSRALEVTVPVMIEISHKSTVWRQRVRPRGSRMESAHLSAPKANFVTRGTYNGRSGVRNHVP